MKKVLVFLAVLAMAGGALTAQEQEPGKWSHMGGIDGSTSASFPAGTFEDSLNNAQIESAAGIAHLKLMYAKRAWDVAFQFNANETGFADTVFTLNWASDMAGFLAESMVGLNKEAFSLGTLTASRLKTWMYLLDRQLDVFFVYNQVQSSVFDTPSDESTYQVALGKAERNGNGSFRITATPNALYGALTFGAVLPVPIASRDTTFAFKDEFLSRSHLFAGFQDGGLIIRGGYWAAPEESNADSWTVVGLSQRNFPIKGITLYDNIQLHELNHWDNRGNIKNFLKFANIPIPGTWETALSHALFYSVHSQTMVNDFKAFTKFKIGPVSVNPFVSYHLEEYSDEVKSGATFSYGWSNIPFPNSAFTAKLEAAEEGIHTTKGDIPPTVVTVKPILEFYKTLVPKYAGFQMDFDTPITINMTNSSDSATKLHTKAMVMFNLVSGGMSRNNDWNIKNNTLNLLADVTYDLTHDEIVGLITVGFNIRW